MVTGSLLVLSGKPSILSGVRINWNWWFFAFAIFPKKLQLVEVTRYKIELFTKSPSTKDL